MKSGRWVPTFRKNLLSCVLPRLRWTQPGWPNTLLLNVDGSNVLLRNIVRPASTLNFFALYKATTNFDLPYNDQPSLFLAPHVSVLFAPILRSTTAAYSHSCVYLWKAEVIIVSSGVELYCA
jgi:hypothetical protein